MNQVKKILFAVLEALLRFVLARKNVVIHYCFITLYVLLSGLISFAVLVLAFLQFLCLLVTTKPVSAIQTLSHRLTVYLYKILRFITLNEPQKPYPFGPLPQEIEPAEPVDLTAELPEKKFFDGDKTEETEAPAGDDSASEAPADESPVADASKEDAPVDAEETPASPEPEKTETEDAGKKPIEMGYGDDGKDGNKRE